MVTIRAENGSILFWIAKIEKYAVRWYEVYGSNKHDHYKAKYAPAGRREGSASRPRERPWRDTIEAGSVFVTFDCLKADATLHIATCKKSRSYCTLLRAKRYEGIFVH